MDGLLAAAGASARAQGQAVSDERGTVPDRLARYLRASERRRPGTIRAVAETLLEQQLADVDEPTGNVDPVAALAEAERLLDADDGAEGGAR